LAKRHERDPNAGSTATFVIIFTNAARITTNYRHAGFRNRTGRILAPQPTLCSLWALRSLFLFQWASGSDPAPIFMLAIEVSPCFHTQSELIKTLSDLFFPGVIPSSPPARATAPIRSATKAGACLPCTRSTSRAHAPVSAGSRNWREVLRGKRPSNVGTNEEQCDDHGVAYDCRGWNVAHGSGCNSDEPFGFDMVDPQKGMR